MYGVLSTSEVLTTMHYINRRFTYLLTYLLTHLLVKAAVCERGHQQTMNHILDMYPLIILFEGGLQPLRDVKD